MLKGLFINVEEEKVEVVEIEDELQSFYNLLKVDLITIPTFSIGGKDYAIVCDDEGLLKENKISAFHSVYGEPSGLVGNLFIVNNGECGELESLTDEDVNRIKRRLIDGWIVRLDSIR